MSVQKFLLSYTVAWIFWLLGHLGLAVVSRLLDLNDGDAFSFFHYLTEPAFLAANLLLVVLFVPFVRAWIDERQSEK